MKWKRKILSASFEKDDPNFHEPKNPRVYLGDLGWGTLTEFSSKGDGYIALEKSGGCLVRNWNHFLHLVQIIELEE